MGALLGHITGGADATTFQPMNINFGLFPPIEGSFKGKERKQAMAVRALRDFDEWLSRRCSRRSETETTMRLMQPEPAAALSVCAP